MSICCRCNNKENWLDNIYCFECYQAMTNTNNHIPRSVVSKEYSKQETMVVSSKKKSIKLHNYISKKDCKKYKLVFF